MQYSERRHAALSAIGPRTMAFPDGEGFAYFCEYDAQIEWLRTWGLVELLPAVRPGGSRRVVRTAEGDRVLRRWNAAHGDR